MDIDAEREKITKEIKELERILDPRSSSINVDVSDSSLESDSDAGQRLSMVRAVSALGPCQPHYTALPLGPCCPSTRSAHLPTALRPLGPECPRCSSSRSLACRGQSRAPGPPTPLCPCA